MIIQLFCVVFYVQEYFCCRCQAEYNKRNELSKDKEHFQELAGFTLFFAELMLSLNVSYFTFSIISNINEQKCHEICTVTLPSLATYN